VDRGAGLLGARDEALEELVEVIERVLLRVAGDGAEVVVVGPEVAAEDAAALRVLQMRRVARRTAGA
jgi:hypothetical protein